MVGNSHTAGRGLFEKNKEMQSIGEACLQGGGVERGEGKVTVSHGYSEKVT